MRAQAQAALLRFDFASQPATKWAVRAYVCVFQMGYGAAAAGLILDRVLSPARLNGKERHACAPQVLRPPESSALLVWHILGRAVGAFVHPSVVPRLTRGEGGSQGEHQVVVSAGGLLFRLPSLL